MNKLFLLPCFLFISTLAKANFDIYQSYAVIGAGNTYYDLIGTSTGNPDLNGANLGSLTVGGTLAFKGGEMRTYKEDIGGCNSNSCGGTINWEVKNSGGTVVLSGNNTLNYDSGFGNQFGGGCSTNQQWDNNNGGSANILNGLGSGSYTIEVWCIANGHDSNDGLCDQNRTQSRAIASFSLAAMPISLTDFRVVRNTTNALITWQTASEINNDHFIIERSDNGIDFYTIGTQKGNGNTPKTTNYIFEDQSPSKNKAYYRLKDVSFDGAFEYSHVVILAAAIKTQIALFPNPIQNEELRFDFESNEDQEIMVTLTDLLGRAHVSTLKNINKGNNNISVPVQVLPAGTYLLRVGTNVDTFVKM